MSSFSNSAMLIITCASELRGHKEFTSFERILLKIAKYTLEISLSAPNVVVLRELGLYPIRVLTRANVVKYWIRISLDHRTLSLIKDVVKMF